VAETAKILWGVYVLLTAVEVVLLMLGGMSFFDALCHAFGTLATGGYSTQNASIGAYNSAYIDYVVTFFMLLAGTNFALHYRFFRGDFKAYFRNREFLFYLSIIGMAAVIIGVDVYVNQYHSIPTTIQKTLFQVVAILTTTGYGTADYEQWSFSSQFTLFMLMFFGGCAGSTGGGMKIIRIFILVKFVFSEITRLLHPHAVVPVRIGENVIPREVVTNVMGFFILFILTFMAGVLVMSSLGLDMATSFGSVAATLANIGPGLGAVGPTDNYAGIPVAGKWVLCMLMLMGRLEVFTVVILLLPHYWHK
jgi:trk system potassium uptake protein TrkH